MPGVADVPDPPGRRQGPGRPARALTFVVPGDVGAPTGGNVWDRRVRDGLRRTGHPVAWRPVPGTWPEPDRHAARGLADVLAGVPDGGTVLLDGLVGCGVPGVVLAHRGRLRLAVVVHLPLADESGLAPATARRRAAAEAAVLAGVDVVVVTSDWAAGRVAEMLPGGAMPVVALPGVDPVPASSVPTRDPVPARLPVPTQAAVPQPDAVPQRDAVPLRDAVPAGEPVPCGAVTPTSGGHLLCLGAVTPRKGQRVLAAALRRLDPRTGWRLRVVGPQPDPAELAALRDDVRDPPLAGRVRLLGPATGVALAAHWRWADLLVVPSLLETFGMVVPEALVRGLPAVVTTGSALPATLGVAAHGPPGLLVPPGDELALAAALHRWLTDPALRAELAARARDRAGELPGWPGTAAAVAAALGLPPPPPGDHAVRHHPPR